MLLLLGSPLLPGTLDRFFVLSSALTDFDTRQKINHLLIPVSQGMRLPSRWSGRIIRALAFTNPATDNRHARSRIFLPRARATGAPAAARARGRRRPARRVGPCGAQQAARPRASAPRQRQRRQRPWQPKRHARRSVVVIVAAGALPLPPPRAVGLSTCARAASHRARAPLT